MLFAVTPLFVRGRQVEGRRVSNVRAIVGEMRIEWVRIPTRSRWMKFAKLQEAGPGGMGQALLPDLLDPEIMGMAPGAFSLSGFELIEGAEYRQAWVLRLP